MKNILKSFIIAYLFTSLSHAQIGMPANTIDVNAVLNINNTDGTNTKGLLLPKVNLTSTSSSSPLAAHEAGMYVYNTKANGNGNTAVYVGPYYNNGSSWIPLGDGGKWSSIGNAETSATNNFIGTEDAVDLVVKTNGTERYRVDKNGKVLIGTTTVPTGGTSAKMIIRSTNKGAVQLKDGTEDAGRVLSSDANGVASWSTQVSVSTLGSFATTGVNIPAATTTWVYTNTSLTLPPGKWLVTLTSVMSKSATATTASGSTELWELNTSFSNSATTLAISTDIPAGKSYISGVLYPNCQRTKVEGSVIINNTSTGNKTYYYMAKAGGRNKTGQLTNFGGNWDENTIRYRKIQ